jgi:WD40 repeat protein
MIATIQGQVQVGDPEAARQVWAQHRPDGAPEARLDGDLLWLEGQLETDREGQQALFTAARELLEQALSGSITLTDDEGGQTTLRPVWLQDSWSVEPPAGAHQVGSDQQQGPDVVDQLEFSPDGATLAVGCTRGWLQTVLLVEADSRRVRHHLRAREAESMGHEGCGRWMSFLGDGSLVTAGRDAVVRRWDVATGRLLARRDLPEIVRASAADPEGRAVAVLQHGASQPLFLTPALEDAPEQPSLHLHGATELALCDSRLLVVERWSTTLHPLGEGDRTEFSGSAGRPSLARHGLVVAVMDGQAVLVRPGWEPTSVLVPGEVLCAALSRAGDTIVLATTEQLLVLGADRHETLWSQPVPEGVRLTAVAISADGRRIAWARDRSYGLVDWADGEQARWTMLGDHPHELSASGARLLSFGDDERWWLLDPGTGELCERLAYESGEHALSGAGQAMLLAEDGRLRVLRVSDGEPMGEVALPLQPYELAVSPDASALVAGSYDQSLLLGLGSGLVRAALPWKWQALAFAARAAVVALLGPPEEAQRVVVLSLASGEVLGRWAISGEVSALALSDDGTQLALVGDSVSVHAPQTGDCRWRLERDASAAAFSPDGQALVVARGGSLQCLSARDGALLRRVRPHAASISLLGFGDDGRLFSVSPGMALAWPAAHGVRSPLPDELGRIGSELARGGEEAREAQARARAREQEPWRPDGEVWAVGGHAPLPPRPPGTPRVERVEGELRFWGEPARQRAREWFEVVLGHGATFEEGDRTLAMAWDVPPEVDRARLLDAAGELTSRACAGALAVVMGDPHDRHVLEAGSRHARTEPLELPAGVLARFGAPAPAQASRIELGPEGGAYRWYLETLESGDEEEGEADAAEVAGHGLVCRLRVVDAQTGQTAVSQRLPFEPELHPSPDGRLATFQASSTMRHMARMGSDRDEMGVVIVDHQLDELVHLHPEGRVHEIETPRWVGELLLVEVRTDEGQRLDCWDARAGAVLWSLEEPGPWCLVGERLAAGGGLLDARTGERLAELSAHDDVYACGPRLVTQRGAVASVHDEGGAVLSEHAMPAPGARLAQDGSWALPSDARARWDSRGRPTSDHTASVVALAARGSRLASLDQQGTLIVRDLSGEVALRGSVGEPDWDWAEHGEPSMAWLDDHQLAVCVGPALRVLDVRTGAWARQAPSELVCVRAGAAGIVTAHRWGRVRGWDAAGTLSFEVPTREGLRRVAVSEDQLLVAGDEDWQLLDLAGEVLGAGPLESPDRELRVALSPEGGWVVVCCSGARLYDAQGELRHEVGDYSARGALFLDEDTLVAAVGGELLQVRCATGEVLRRVAAHRGWISALALGEGPLTGGEDGVALWERGRA